MEIQRNFYAIIPANVRYSDMSAGAKLLYGEITALTNEKGYCWASNDYFTKLYNTTNRTVQNWLAELENGNFIKREYIYHDNSREIAERHIYILGSEVVKKISWGGEKNFTPYINNIKQEIDTNITQEKDIVEFLNEKLNTNFKPTSKNTRKHINARLSEGYTVDDFKTVIEKKVAEWGDDPKMAKYLRPDTLFGSKFESYLNQKVVEPKSKIEINAKQREGMTDVVDWGM